MEENTYMVDPESEAEMARLVEQDFLTTRLMRNLVPDSVSIQNEHTILDIACGPGGWGLEVAITYPESNVFGIDISQRMIQYANAQAESREATNAHFQVMNALQPLAFPDTSFDIINARYLVSFMPTSAWSTLMQECRRLLKPSGKIIITDSEIGFSTNKAMELAMEYLARALNYVGHGFSPTGRAINILPMLAKFLQDGGFTDIQPYPYWLDSSRGTENHNQWIRTFLIALHGLRPLIFKINAVASEEEFEQLLAGVQASMEEETYNGSLVLSVVGTAPSTPY